MFSIKKIRKTFNFLFSFYHYFLSFLGNLIYFFPSKKIFVFGVTGTKGKSTTLEIINFVLEKNNFKTALVSSIRVKIGEDSFKNLLNSMPGRFFLKKFLRKAVSKKCQIALIEVTSEGILQHRHKFIHWDAVAFLNLAPEHIEAHGSYENYRQAKVNLFEYAVNFSKKPKLYFFVNQLDKEKEYFKKPVLESKKQNVEIIEFNKEEFLKTEVYKNLNNEWLKTDFNLENLTLSYNFLKLFNLEEEKIWRALNEFKGVPGRFEIVVNEPFKVIIDYAHTPDSLLKIYTLIKEKYLNEENKLIGVLGSAGGGRDKWKREVMGEIAGKFCDFIILTNEDPYDEDPIEIISQIEKGVRKVKEEKNIFKILDRFEAILKALSLAKKGDVVILTGKGSESFIHLKNNKKIAWQEKEKVLEAYKKIYEEI